MSKIPKKFRRCKLMPRPAISAGYSSRTLAAISAGIPVSDDYSDRQWADLETVARNTGLSIGDIDSIRLIFRL
jgi:hypothetical protein